MSAVNLSAVEAKLSDRGLGKGGLEDLPASLDPQTLAFVQAQAALAAGLRCLTRRVGLSLGDQACLALTIPAGLPAVTTDRSCSRLAPATAAEVSWPDDTDPDAAGPLDSRQMAGGLVERGGSASWRWAGRPPQKPAIQPRERRDESRSLRAKTRGHRSLPPSPALQTQHLPILRYRFDRTNTYASSDDYGVRG